jgi:hypothetical protein
MLDRCGRYTIAFRQFHLGDFSQANPDQGHMMDRMFQVIHDLAVVVGIEIHELGGIIIVYPFQLQVFIFLSKTRMDFPEQAKGKFPIRFNFFVALPVFVVDGSGYISFFKALKHFDDVPDMLTDGGMAKILAGLTVLFSG